MPRWISRPGQPYAFCAPQVDVMAWEMYKYFPHPQWKNLKYISYIFSAWSNDPNYIVLSHRDAREAGNSNLLQIISLCDSAMCMLIFFQMHFLLKTHTTAVTRNQTALNILLIVSHCFCVFHKLKLLPPIRMCPFFTTKFTSFPIGTMRKSIPILMQSRIFQILLQNPCIYTCQDGWHSFSFWGLRRARL